MTLGGFSEPNPRVNNGTEYDNHGFIHEWSNGRSGRGHLNIDHDDPELVPDSADADYRGIGNWIHRNNEAHWDTETVGVDCDNCGQRFEKRRMNFRKHDHHFHNQDCFAEWFTGSNNPQWDGGRDDYYGPTWQEQRRQAYERDNSRCQHCGIGELDHISEYGCSPHVHHVVPHHYFNDTEVANDSSNLITLCAPCHAKHERWADRVAESQGFK